MKKIRISENELVNLIEKLVKENLSTGTGFDFGMLGTPTSKYKDLAETEDIEEDDITDNEEEVSEETLNLNVDDETQDGLNQEDYMESITEQENPESCCGGVARLIDDLEGMMDSDGNVDYHQLLDELAKIAHGMNESRLISRLKRRLNEQEGKGCSESEGGSGCIKKGSYTDGKGKKYPWHILNNKKGGIWRGCTSKKDCESILDAFHANS